MKKLQYKKQMNGRHWVGDGFPVRNIFGYHDIAHDMSPFLMLDYAGPFDFGPNTGHPRGVGEHPHRGFETVTIAYDGEVEHRDSAGGGGMIKRGDVQWMTAASGLVHEEMHSKEFSKNGGRFEVVQLWVNLPAKDKMTKPRYQAITNEQIKEVKLADNAGVVRIIAGEYDDAKGPAKTFTPMNLWDIRLNSGGKMNFTVKSGDTASIFVLSGKVKLGTGEIFGEAELAVLERKGDAFTVEASEDSKLLFMGGEPIEEDIVGSGPFVMNTPEEIQQAYNDYRAGRMGHIAVQNS